MTFGAAGSNLSIAVFHSNNDNSLFHTQGLYCMNRFFCVMTATLILHVFKNTLDELPDCSYRHFVFSIHIYSLLKYLIIWYSFIYCQLNIKNESDLCVSLFFADYMYINGKYDGIIFFLTEKSPSSIEKITSEKPVAIWHPVPPAPPPPNPPV
jgi:tellurite resistance protein TehA-like permease